MNHITRIPDEKKIIKGVIIDFFFYPKTKLGKNRGTWWKFHDVLQEEISPPKKNLFITRQFQRTSL